ncbi:hypothetical protein DL546_004404 [Coniochaeta pulveracea]|uniref:VOC domain-containing protein n=1 Tax=Coniochaeta pulveracea TaxID=177199 RepID=A0A420Y1C8_9PEZI|nr:hypothetical protein DL546_004404 [Coniochaeta pulveracea]
MIPFLEVAHLPSSTSFYSAIVQPLGLRYIPDPEPEAKSSSASGFSSAGTGRCVTYGTSSLPPAPVFQLRQVSTPKPSWIVLSARSPSSVADFHRFSLRANPDLVPATGLGHRTAPETEESRARVIDYDGNTMEVVYSPPTHSRYGEGSLLRTQSTTAEASRILKWNYGVTASSNPPMTAARRPEAGQYAATAAKQEPSASGLSASTVMGTLLGVAAGAAAGAALTYTMVKQEQSRSSRHAFEAPEFARRSTFPMAHPSSAERPVPSYSQMEQVEHGISKMGLSNDYTLVDARRSPPEYIARYSHTTPSRKAKSRVAEDVGDDARSRHSSRSRHSHASVRTRSANPESRRPLMITETEHRSHVGSSTSPSRDSYVSAHSQRSDSTIRPPPAPSAAASQLLARSRAGSRVISTTVTMPAQSHPSTPRALSRTGSYMSARNVPLPPSVASSRVSSHHPWNVPLPPSNVGSTWDDDTGSVAPSDSISCVGSRRSRSYYA